MEAWRYWAGCRMTQMWRQFNAWQWMHELGPNYFRHSTGRNIGWWNSSLFILSWWLSPMVLFINICLQLYIELQNWWDKLNFIVFHNKNCICLGFNHYWGLKSIPLSSFKSLRSKDVFYAPWIRLGSFHFFKKNDRLVLKTTKKNLKTKGYIFGRKIRGQVCLDKKQNIYDNIHNLIFLKKTWN